MMSMRVFFDTNVLMHAVRREHVACPVLVEWGGRVNTLQVHEIAEKPPRTDWLQEEIDCLPAVAAFVKDETIRPCISTETIMDGMGRGVSRLYESELSIFEGIEFERAGEPEELGMTRIAFGAGFNPGEVRKKFLSTNVYARFNELKAAAGGNKDADAFLIWTAESAGIEYFLTTDRKLVNSVRGQRSCVIGTHVLYPSELLKLLDAKR